MTIVDDNAIIEKQEAWKMARFCYWAFLLLLPLSLIIVSYWGLPAGSICLFHIISGFDCPGCGMTRAFRAMAELDVAGSFRYNPLGPIVFVVVLAGWFYALARLLTVGKIQFSAKWQRRITHFFWLLLWVYLGVGLLRLALEISGKIPVLK